VLNIIECLDGNALQILLSFSILALKGRDFSAMGAAHRK